ncbi:prenyltransferase [Brevibacterium luteolum]|uniref:Prenyltransferase n=1 Tax=Brevibacterium luteolum TaxID=199591 RepID=A0A849AVF5_9MICO|nr:4-hydroxybenzoate polyprenyltransferase [Brevibacterium luteolum]NNG80041.1 prenyltransferase [Brevibacterium luteolum]
MSTLGLLTRTSRPVSWVNTSFPFGAAYLLTGGGVDAPFVLGCLFFLIPYNLAMYGINDVFDYESDIRNPRKGGIEGHVTAPKHHRTILISAAVSCLPFLAALVVLGDWRANLVLAISMFAVAAYSVRGLRFKEIPFLDAVTSSTHFSSPAWYGLALTGAPLDRNVAVIFAAFFIWGVASQAFGAVQDIGPDRAGGLASIATVIGARSTVWLATAAYIVAGVLLLYADSFLVRIAAVLALPYAINTGRFAGLTDESAERARAGWRVFLWLNYVVGFCVTMLMIASVMGF